MREMFGLRQLLMFVLAGFGSVFTFRWGLDVTRRRKAMKDPAGEGGNEESASMRPGLPSPAEAGIGFLTNFFDTLGIGSYATTTSIYKLFRLVPDHRIPGTLLVGHMWPTVAQAVIYITIIQVEMTSLVLLIAASILGSWLGAGVVSAWPRRKIQVGMGFALLGAAVLMLAKAVAPWLHSLGPDGRRVLTVIFGVVLGLAGLAGVGAALSPSRRGTRRWIHVLVPVALLVFAVAVHSLRAGGDTLGLHGWRLAVGLVGSFTFGALMNLGIGAYAPSLILFGFLGMNLKAIFPVMMGSCAFIMPTSGIRFIGRGNYAPRAALGLALGGVPGVLLAAYVIKQLPVQYLLWLVIVVATYSALAMLGSARKERSS